MAIGEEAVATEVEMEVMVNMAAGMAAGGRANDRVVCGGQRPHARAHLQTRRALLVLTATGAGRARSSDYRHKVHHDAAVRVLLLQRPEVVKRYLTTRRHMAHGEFGGSACKLSKCLSRQMAPGWSGCERGVDEGRRSQAISGRKEEFKNSSVLSNQVERGERNHYKNPYLRPN